MSPKLFAKLSLTLVPRFGDVFFFVRYAAYICIKLPRMLDLKALYSRIDYLRNEIIPYSISPMRLGSILHEMLDQIKEAYRQGLGQDLEDALENAEITLDKAQNALDILTVAIEKLEKALHVTIVDRGPWDKYATYYFEALNPATAVIETSDVWNYYCRYRCLVTGTKQEPRWDSTDWLFIEGNPDFYVEFLPHANVCRITDIDITLEIVAWMHNVDITADIIDADIVWSRYSEDADGNPRTLSDQQWNKMHALQGKACHITLEDIDYNGRIPKTLRFSAEVTLRDGKTPVAMSVASLSISQY